MSDVPGAEGEGIDVSVIIPVFNDAPTLAETCRRVADALDARGCTHEIVLVDDGSTDGSWAEMRRLGDGPGRIIAARLARNAGQTAAWCAGIAHAGGRRIVTIDADLDTQPEDVVVILEAMDAGADVVNGARVGRHWQRGLPSKVFNAGMRRRGLPYTDMGCGTLGLSAAVAKAVLDHGDLRRGYRIKVLVAQLATEFVEVPVRAGSSSPSSYRVADLVSAGMEAELATRRTVLVWPAILAGLLALLSAVAALAVTVGWVLGGDGELGWLALGAWLTSAIWALVAVAGMALNLAFRAARERSAPFYEVAEVFGVGR